MRSTGTKWVRAGTQRILALLMTTGALLALGAWAGAATSTAAPAHTDVMFVFDTSGSMSSVLEEAKSEVQEVMTQIGGTVPDAQFGVAEVKDTGEEEFGLYAWKLDAPVSSNMAAVREAIAPLEANGGGDGPEAYGRALYETDTNPDVGWRSGARHLIVLIGDEVPHDHNLNEGIEERFWFSNPFETGEELEATAGIKDTQWKIGVPLEFHKDLERLRTDEKPLQAVDFHDTEGDFIHYWEAWAGLTGGRAVEAQENGKELATKLTTVVEEGVFGSLPPCPSGQERNSKLLCVAKPPSPPTPPHSTATQVICNLVLATASDTCTATVGDSASSNATNPTGTVTFTSASGGVFSSGNTCTLVNTPLSSNTSSCSVQFLPPSTPSTLPAISGSYGGDATHASSSGQTHYAAASELAGDIKLSPAGTITLPVVEIPIVCGFPCAASGSLETGPDLAKLTSVTTVTLEPAVAATSQAKKKKAKPLVIGKGTLKLSAPGKGKLLVKLSPKGRRALSHVGKKGVRLTLRVTITTLNGTLVSTKTERITLHPKAKKAKKKK